MLDGDLFSWAVASTVFIFLGGVLMMLLPPDFHIAAWAMLVFGALFGFMAIQRLAEKFNE